MSTSLSTLSCATSTPAALSRPRHPTSKAPATCTCRCRNKSYVDTSASCPGDTTTASRLPLMPSCAKSSSTRSLAVATTTSFSSPAALPPTQTSRGACVTPKELSRVPNTLLPPEASHVDTSSRTERLHTGARRAPPTTRASCAHDVSMLRTTRATRSLLVCRLETLDAATAATMRPGCDQSTAAYTR